jgi:hypothetical protein
LIFPTALDLKCSSGSNPNAREKISRKIEMGKASRAKVAKGLVKKDTGINKITPVTKLELLTHIIAAAPESRGKRKRAIKRARIETRNQFVAAALKSKSVADSSRTFGSALGDFSDLTAAMTQNEQDVSPVTPNLSKLTRRNKGPKGALKRNQKLKADSVDVGRVQTLLNIPDFAADPMAAIEKHLLNARKKREEKAALEGTSDMEVSA